MSVKRKNKQQENRKEDRQPALVPCPTCGNDDLDKLVFDDRDSGADLVACLICGTRYNQLTGEFQTPF